MARLVVKQGSLAWDGQGGRGGFEMFNMQWLVGLKRLGHDVLYYETSNGDPKVTEEFGKIIERWWDPSRAARIRHSGESDWGLDRYEVEEFAASAAAIIFLGATYEPEPPPWLADIRPRVLLEQDPGFTHLWAKESSPEDIFGNHDFYFTVGANVGTARCTVPTFGIEWLPIWYSIILDWWNPQHAVTNDRFTTLAGWWSGDSQVFEGKRWGPKAEQWSKFIHLPKRVPVDFEIALGLEPDDPKIRKHLELNGWNVTDPHSVTPDLEGFREYVNGSKGQFSCAKGLYVGTRCGWFSDVSACYLAAGRPVVLQDTGFGDALPLGAGLFSVATEAEAVDAMEAIIGDWERHSAAAREIACEEFDSGRVLTSLLKHVGVH